jgi:N-methylhydantoinase A
MERSAARDLREEGFAPGQVRCQRLLAMRYRGQSFEIEVEMSPRAIAQFHQAHHDRYGHSDASRPVEIVSVRMRGIGMTEKPVLAVEKRFKKHRARAERVAQIWIEDRRRKVSIYERAPLLPGATIDGPAIILEYGSTILVPPRWRAIVDGYGNLLLDRAGAPA